MAYYIEIRRTSDNADGAAYEYGDGQSIWGAARLDKSSGEVAITAAPTGNAAGAQIAARVRTRLREHWQRGESPAITSWSS